MTVLYENSEYAVIDKPAGLDSEREVPKALSEQLGGDFYTVHRLDREVSGIMVYAKNPRAAGKLSAAEYEKEYLALVSGCPESESGILTDLLYHDKGRNKTYTVKKERAGVKKAELSYRTVEKREGQTLLSLTLKTGRTHQIRVQLASRHVPIVGDRKYGGTKAQEIALRAVRLSYTDPWSGETMTFEVGCEF